VARPWPGGEKRRGGRASHHEACEAIGAFLLPYATTELSLSAVCCLIGATPRGQPWTSAVLLPHGRNGLNARRMAVLWTFREPSLGRHVHRELLRNAVLDLTPIIPATACHYSNDVEPYSRLTYHARLATRSRTTPQPLQRGRRPPPGSLIHRGERRQRRPA
jgi:hypothetical protein